MKEKYNAFFNLYALGNILAYHDGHWVHKELKHYRYDHINEYISDFISLGGINGINIKKWISLDTVQHLMAESKAVLKYKNDDTDKFVYLLKNELIRYFNKIEAEEEKYEHIYRKYDLTTFKYIEIFTEKNDARNIILPNADDHGGTYAGLRSMVLGLKYHKKKDIENLVEYTYLSTIITHNSITSFLLSIVLSYFTSLAVQEISLEKWPFMLVKLLESDFVKKHVGDDNENFYHYLSVLNSWKNYISNKFDKNNKKIKLKSFNNLIFRMKFYNDTFLVNKLKNESLDEYIIKNYILHTIIAYDSLLDCDGYFEKLLFYSVFVYIIPTHKVHIGTMACGLYGIVYGFGDVPKSLLLQIEFKKELTTISNDFFTSFF